jgi:hypothetical protein
LALGRAFAPFLFWTFDDCFLRLAMVDPLVGAPLDARSQKTTRPESRQPTLRVINRRSRLGHDFGGIADIGTEALHCHPEHTSDYFQRANLTRYNALS